jgi:uncharacterized protein
VKVSRRALLRSFALGAAASVGTMAYADYSAYGLVLERRELRLPKWDADGFRVAVISDIHADYVSAMKRAKEAVRMAMAEKPDMLVMVGDFVSLTRPYTLDHIRWSFEELAGVDYPCLAVMGNHDYWAHEPEKIIDAVSQTPLKLLRNEIFEYEGITVAGLDDAIAKRHLYSFFPPHICSKSLLALWHEPDFVDQSPAKHVSLQISGHSHGGQMCLPFGVSMHTPYGARKYTAGFYENAPVPLYVSRGVGTIGMDLRLFCRPEVSLLTLRSA